MLVPGLPPDELRRLERLHALEVLYTPASSAYDEVVRLAHLRFRVPIALISLVSEREQWFKACFGLDATATGRDISFCGHAILGDEVFVIEDALEDERFADNPLVTGPPHIRFYAGCPLHLQPGLALGTLCIIDTVPREFPASDRERLCKLADIVVNLLREREQAVELAADLLGVDVALARREMIDPATGVWSMAAFESIAAATLQHARRARQTVALYLLAPERNLDGRGLLLREIGRRVRASLPPLSAHFHVGEGRFYVLAVIDQAEDAEGGDIRLKAALDDPELGMAHGVPALKLLRRVEVVEPRQPQALNVLRRLVSA